MQRDLYGRWAAELGAVYPNFRPSDPPDSEPVQYDIGFDFADSSVSHAVLAAVWPKQMHVISEWRHNGDKQGSRTTDEQTRDVKSWVDSLGVTVNTVYCDPAASHMITSLRRGGFNAMPAVNDVLPGIRQVQSDLQQGKLGVSPVCTETVREMAGYQWDERAAERGEDKPLKEHDHAPDALRYLDYTKHAKLSVKRGTYAR